MEMGSWLLQASVCRAETNLGEWGEVVPSLAVTTVFLIVRGPKVKPSLLLSLCTLKTKFSQSAFKRGNHSRKS